jgi:hypothetical protein
VSMCVCVCVCVESFGVLVFVRSGSSECLELWFGVVVCRGSEMERASGMKINKKISCVTAVTSS